MYKSPILKITFALLVAFYAYECRQSIHVKHKGFYNVMHKKCFSGFIGMEKYNREKLGIEFSDLVICIPDPSNNISLYLMNQPGWTEYGAGHLKGANRIDYLIEKGAKFLFISDPNILNNEQYDYLIPYMKNKIGQYKNVAVFDLTNLNSEIPANVKEIKDDITAGKSLISTKGPGSFHFKGFKTQYPKLRLDTSLAHRSNMHGYNRLCRLSSDFFKKDQWYELSFWYYNKGLRPEVNMIVNQVDEKDNQDWTDYFSMKNGSGKKDDWTLISHYFTCKKDAKTLNFTLHYKPESNEKIYYTDFLIRQADADVYYLINDTLLFKNNKHIPIKDGELMLAD